VQYLRHDRRVVDTPQDAFRANRAIEMGIRRVLPAVPDTAIAAWEKDLNLPLASQVLSGNVTVDLTTDALPAAQPAE
jgi:hypothetical protein